jgi:hypothetical protein
MISVGSMGLDLTPFDNKLFYVPSPSISCSLSERTHLVSDFLRLMTYE